MTVSEHTFDLVVVGSGIAGQVAATTASEAGLSTVLLEKTERLGGSSAMSGGYFAFSGTAEQASEGVADSAELFMRDLLESGRQLNDRALLETYLERQEETYRWLKDHGVTFRALEISSGQSAARSHNSAIKDVLAALQRDFATHGGDTRLNHRATQLVTGDSGTVTGVIADTGDGEQLFTGRAGVVLATGGFSRGADLLRIFAPDQLAAIPYGGRENTGDGLKMAWKLGAGMADMAFISGTYGSHPDTGEDFHELLTAYYLGAIVVNRHGRRFVDESQSYKILGREVLKQPDGLGFEIFDADVRVQSQPGIPLTDIDMLEELGHLYKADTLAELAELTGIDPDGLANTVARYNAVVDDQHEDELGRTSLCNGVGALARVDRPPFYAYPAKSLLTSTFSGVTITPAGQVTDINNDIIDGLYAVGEITGGFHGAAYITGTSLGKGAVFGRIVAQHAATRVKENHHVA